MLNKATITGPALRYHGGKYRLAGWILEHFPQHRCYVEAFGGAASVLLKKPRSYSEVYNDLDGEIVNFFRVLRDPQTCQQLIAALTMTPYARAEFELAYQMTDDPVEMARRVAVRAQMGFGSAGATKSTTGFRIDTKRPYNTAQHLWTRYPDNVAAVAERFSSVLIENRNALTVMQQHDSADTLHYVDPPYVWGTRVLRNRKGCYKHEMTDDQHVELLTGLNALKGMVVLSGYDSDLYNDLLSQLHWINYARSSRASAYRGTKMTWEMIWINPACADALQSEALNKLNGFAVYKHVD